MVGTEGAGPWWRRRITVAFLAVTLVLVVLTSVPIPRWVLGPFAPPINDPLAGRIVFGDTFDKSFAVQGERTWAARGQPTVWVAHAADVLPAGQPVTTVYLWDGVEASRTTEPIGQDWQVLGLTLPGGFLDRAGSLTVRVLTAGNEIIAQGSLGVQ